MQYFYSLTQRKLLTENAVVHLFKNHGHLNINPTVLDGLGVMLTRCRPILNGFWQNQQEAAVNACLGLVIECTQ